MAEFKFKIVLSLRENFIRRSGTQSIFKIVRKFMSQRFVIKYGVASS